MKAPISLIKEYLDFNLSPEELSEILTLGGIEVEGIETTPLQFSGVVVGKVVDIKPHPDAEHLRVATVSDGKEEFQVVCGAPNCEMGMKTAFAKIGATLFDKENKSFKIKKSKLRGIESHGMLCSLEELGLAGDEEGIMTLSEELILGTDLTTLYSDVILDISLTPNLGHCMSIYGLAREISALLNLPLKKREFSFEESGIAIEDLIKIQLIDKHQCVRYACRAVLDIEVGPAPDWLKKKIEACGLRSIDNVVDIGNLVMLELGQPLHLFDLDKIEGNQIFITAQTDFKELETLDDTVRFIPPDSVLICDSQKPLALAGVMGGKSSAVTENTRNILIEAAVFTPQAIRKSSKILGLKTDSSQRFEKGIDPNGVIQALEYAATLLQQVAKGQVVKGVIDKSAHAFHEKKIGCRVNRVNQLLGTQLSSSEIAALLQRLGMTIAEESLHQLLVQIPTHRNDIGIEEDLIEEVARLYGYNNIPKTMPRHVDSTLFHTPVYLLEKEARRHLIGLGLQEMMTCDLIHPDQAKMTCESTMTEKSLISVLQPSSLDQSVLRTSLLPGLLQALKYNADHGNENFSGFEVGRVHFKEAEKIFEPSTVGIILTGMSSPYHFDPKPRAFDFFDLKGIVENFFEGLGIKDYFFEVSHLHNFHPGRQARIKIENSCIGVIAEVHPERLQASGIIQKVYYAEMNLNELLPLLPKKRTISDIAAFPGSERDWTITLPDEVPVALILDTVRTLPTRLLEKIALLDLYKSDQIGKDKKNVTFRFSYRDKQKTIAFETVEREHARIIQTVEDRLKMR